MTHHRDSEDVDSIISSTMHGQAVTAASSALPAKKSRKVKLNFRLRKEFSKRLILIAGLALALLIVLLPIMLLIHSRLTAKSVFPSSIRDAAKFNLYYPTQLPDGYALTTDSIRIEQNIVFYTFKNNENVITISEQAVPNPKPVINNTSGNSEVKVIENSIGKATVGTVKGIPVGVMVTDTTSINVSTTTKIPTEDIIKIVESLDLEG